MKVEGKQQATWLPYRLGVVLFVTGCSYFTIWINVYATSEWLQDKVKREIFSNGSESLNLSKCGAVNKSNPVYREHQRVQQITAKWQMYNTIAIKSVSLFITVVFAVYTDVLGRRFMFILSSFSVFLNLGLTALVMYFDMRLEYLVGANAIYGLTGTSYGLVSVAYSAVADMTPNIAERSFGIFLLDMSIGVSGTLGSLGVGFYIQHYGFIYPAFTAAAIQVIVIIVAIVFIKESLPKVDRIKAPPLKLIFLKPFVFYSSSDFKGSRLLFLTLLFAFIFDDMTGVHFKTMETLYQLAEPFCWSPSKIGVYATLKAFGQYVFGLTGFKVLKKFFTEISIVMMAEIANTASLVIDGLATTSMVLYAASIPTLLNTLSSSLIRGTMSKMTSKNQQGALFASILVVQTIASILTGISENAVYAATITIFNGLFFFVIAGYAFLAFLCLVLFRIILKRSSTKHTIRDIDENNADERHVKQADPTDVIVNSDSDPTGKDNDEVRRAFIGQAAVHNAANPINSEVNTGYVRRTHLTHVAGNNDTNHKYNMDDNADVRRANSQGATVNNYLDTSDHVVHNDNVGCANPKYVVILNDANPMNNKVDSNNVRRATLRDVVVNNDESLPINLQSDRTINGGRCDTYGAINTEDTVRA